MSTKVLRCQAQWIGQQVTGKKEKQFSRERNYYISAFRQHNRKYVDIVEYKNLSFYFVFIKCALGCDY